MVTILHSYTLENAQKDYRAKEATLRRQSMIGAPGLGKGSATNQLVGLGLIESKADAVYEFSTRLKALAHRCPALADEILPKIDAGVLVDPKYVRMAYEQDLTDFGFGINSRLEKGNTIIYDGLPRQAGLPKELNQVAMLRDVHNGNVFDLVTIMRHSDDYVPVLRQLIREFEHTQYSGKNGRPDTFKAVKRLVGYNAKLPDLVTEVKGISQKTIEFHADNVTPTQTAFMYLTMAANDDVLEEEVRALSEFSRLGKEKSYSITERVKQAKFASQTHGGDNNAEDSVNLLEKQIEKVLQAQQSHIPFNEFVNMWKAWGYYDLDLSKE